MSRVYYQPILTDKEWEENTWFNSFDVYHSFANAKHKFPNSEIGAYSGDDIENPSFLDEMEHKIEYWMLGKQYFVIVRGYETSDEALEAVLETFSANTLE